MPPAGGMAAVRFLLPHHAPGLRVERVDAVAHRSRIARQLDVASDDALDDLRFGHTLLRELGDVVVTEDAG